MEAEDCVGEEAAEEKGKKKEAEAAMDGEKVTCNRISLEIESITPCSADARS